MKNTKNILAGAMAVALTAPMVAMATNGYFAIGYGSNSRGMAGVGVALPKDATAAASNPAGMGMVGNSAVVGVELFSPADRSADSGFLGQPRHSESDRNLFLIPHFGYVTKLDNKMSFGVSVFGNGGMNTQYNPDTAGGVNLFGAADKLGVDLAQLLIAPTIAYKVNDKNTIGASVILGYQRFKAQGLQNFCSLKAGAVDAACSGFGAIGTAAANAGLTNQGYDDAMGWGVRIGWIGEINDKVTLGATFASRVYMSEFDKYNQLFAEQGDFDIPANFAVGIAVKATPKLTVAFDIQEILYGDVNSIANTGPALTGAAIGAGSGNLGTDNGLGFGWEDQTVYKLGVEYVRDAKWTYRAGINYGSSPIPDTELAFNIIAPAVVEKHLTLGFTYKQAKNAELTFAYMRAFDEEQTGAFPAAFGGGTTKLQMEQNAIEASYSWKF